MDFFGNTLTVSGDIIGPDTLLYDPDDETLMSDIKNAINGNSCFKIGQLHAIFPKFHPSLRFYLVQDINSHPYWVVNLFNQQEAATGYDSIKDLITNNFDKIWGKNIRQF